MGTIKKFMLAAAVAAIFMPVVSVRAMDDRENAQAQNEQEEDQKYEVAVRGEESVAAAGEVATKTAILLHRAVQNRDLAGVLWWLESGKNPNIPDEDGEMPFGHACTADEFEGQEEMVKALYMGVVAMILHWI